MSYKPAAAGVESMDAMLDRLSRLEAEATSALADVKEARRPVVGSAARTVKAYQAAGRGKTGDFRSIGDFCQTVYKANNDPNHKRIRDYIVKSAPTGMNETVGADGGFLVPPQFSNELLQRTYDNDLLSRTTMFPMTSNVLKIPAVNETSRADGSRFGGIQAYFRAEAQTVTASKPNFAQVALNLEPLTLIVRVTDELLEDSGTALETYVNNIASQELQFKIGDAIINGTGVNTPLGILNSPAKVTVSKEDGQTAATITTENVVKMWSRLHLSCRSNAIWLVNQDVEPSLLTLTLGIGTAGVATYMPPGGLSGQPYATLMGRPVITTEFNPTLGTEGDIVLWDPSTYLTGTKGGLMSAVSMHVYFLSSEQALRFTMRLDGRPWWLSALSPFKGSATKSCIVTLETRS